MFSKGRLGSRWRAGTIKVGNMGSLCQSLRQVCVGVGVASTSSKPLGAVKPELFQNGGSSVDL